MVTSVASRSRRVLVGLLAAMLVVLLAACGGSSDLESEVPAPQGAERLDAQNANDDDFDELGFAGSDGVGTIYTSTASVDEVTTFYSQDITDEGWTVGSTLPLGEAAIVMANKEDRVVLVNIMKGSAFKSDPSAAGLEEFDIDEDEIGDDETLFAVIEFTCDETDVAACLALGQ